jgi:DHA1 family multidrug resistance protein-like MFS transporter
MRRDLILVASALFTWGIGEGMFFYFEPLYLQQLGADPILIGGILGGVGAAMAISYLPAGILSDRLGRRPMLWLAWLTGVTATGIMALSKSLPLFVAGMALYGFTSFVTVPLNSYLTHARGNWSVGRTLTSISASFSAGVILGPLLGGWIGDHYGLQYTFQIAAFIFVISTLIIFFISPQPVERSSDPNEKTTWREWINPRYIQYLLVIFVVTFAIYLPQPLSQNFLQNQRGLNLEQIGQLIATRSLGIVVLNLVLGYLNARVGYILAQICMALFALFLWKGTGMPWYLAGYFLLGSYQTARSLAVAQGRTLIQTAYMGVGYGLLETGMTTAMIFAPLLAGYLYQENPISIYTVSLVIIGFGIIITKFLSPIKSRDVD